MRLFVNFFQPSFKLAAKARDGAQVRKRYYPPATPCQRLLADPRTNEEVRRRVNQLRATLDPVGLLNEIRAVQQQLVEIADRPAAGEIEKPTLPTLEQFLAGLRTAWKEGEIRPTSVAKAKPKRLRRRPDPFAAVTTELQQWFEAEPWHTSRELLERLQAQYPGVYPDGRLRTLQRRLKVWRREAAHRMVFGKITDDPGAVPASTAD
jgi:non-ribosomal peptide synthetase component F